MAVKNATYIGGIGADTGRGPSEYLTGAPGGAGGWIADFLQDPSLGMYFYEDFLVAPNYPGGSYTGSAGRWSIFSTANGAFADDGIVGGGLRLQASTTADQGVTLGSDAGAYRLITAAGALQGRLAFECRVLASTGSYTASTQDTFVGLCDTTPASQIPITNTNGTLASTISAIGFHKRGGATVPQDWSFVFCVSGQTIQYPTNLTTLVTTVTGTAPVVGTYYKLGFVFDPTPSCTPLYVSSVASSNQTVSQLAAPIIRVFVNGQPAAAFLIKADVTAATFPTGVMAPVFAFMQQSTTSGIYSAIDWLSVAQAAIS